MTRWKENVEGDIVRTPAGGIGVVIALPSQWNPGGYLVLVLREDEKFGGYDGAFHYPDPMWRIGHVESDTIGGFGIAAKAWLAEKKASIRKTTEELVGVTN